MEQVLVVQRSDFFDGRWPQGFFPRLEPRGFLTALTSNGFFVPLDHAENNSIWKQPIPYCVVTSGDRVFTVQRTRGQSEARLHGLYSIGLGGHVEPQDRGDPLFERALRRELDEELVIPDLDHLQLLFLGLLNDDSNPVGRVHMGLVYGLDVGDPTDQQKPVQVRESSKMTGGFRSLVGSQNLWQDRSRFETWSRILLKALVVPSGGSEESGLRLREAKKRGNTWLNGEPSSQPETRSTTS